MFLMKLNIYTVLYYTVYLIDNPEH